MQELFKACKGSQNMLGLQSTSLGLPLQEARACWKAVEESYQPHQDLQILLEAQASLSGVSPPPLGSNGALPASSAPAPTETPAAATPSPSAAAVCAPARPQVLHYALMLGATALLCPFCGCHHFCCAHAPASSKGKAPLYDVCSSKLARCVLLNLRHYITVH